jgi:hypothetical protein
LDETIAALAHREWKSGRSRYLQLLTARRTMASPATPERDEGELNPAHSIWGARTFS